MEETPSSDSVRLDRAAFRKGVEDILSLALLRAALRPKPQDKQAGPGKTHQA